MFKRCCPTSMSSPLGTQIDDQVIHSPVLPSFLPSIESILDYLLFLFFKKKFYHSIKLSLHQLSFILSDSLSFTFLITSPLFFTSLISLSSSCAPMTCSPLDGVTIATTEEEAKQESKSSGSGGPMDIDGTTDQSTSFTATPFLWLCNPTLIHLMLSETYKIAWTSLPPFLPSLSSICPI